MAGNNNPQRRRAAWAVLASVLDEDSLIEALWLQHDTMRGEGVSDIIGFIDHVGSQHLLDVATRKRLYAAFFDALRQPEAHLPIDPWPLMLQTRPAAAGTVGRAAFSTPTAWPAAGFAAAQPVPAPVAMPPPQPEPIPTAPAPAPSAQQAPPAPMPEAPPPAAPSGPAHQVVFANVVAALLNGVRQFHPQALGDFVVDCRTRLEHTGVSPGLRQAARDALVSADPKAWHLEATPAELSALAHEFYVTLCESLGPVDADQILMHAVRHAEQLREAREFPPGRLL
jgi:hypothetical protein